MFVDDRLVWDLFEKFDGRCCVVRQGSTLIISSDAW